MYVHQEFRLFQTVPKQRNMLSRCCVFLGCVGKGSAQSLVLFSCTSLGLKALGHGHVLRVGCLSSRNHTSLITFLIGCVLRNWRVSSAVQQLSGPAIGAGLVWLPWTVGQGDLGLPVHFVERHRSLLISPVFEDSVCVCSFRRCDCLVDVVPAGKCSLGFLLTFITHRPKSVSGVLSTGMRCVEVFVVALEGSFGQGRSCECKIGCSAHFRTKLCQIALGRAVDGHRIESNCRCHVNICV
jgi:hypothetical protein